MSPNVTDWIQAASALLTMLAAGAALVVAVRAPRLAAKFADDYRRQSAAADERERFRMSVFQSLMKHRSELLAQDARAAINLVDLAFSDVAEVRDARRLFMEAASQSSSSATTLLERYFALIEAVARAMKLSDSITGFDVRTGYYPKAIGTLDHAALIEAEEKIAKTALKEFRS